MSGTRAKKRRKLTSILTKKVAIPIAICGLSCIPMRANADIIFSVFPHYVQPLPVGDTHSIQSGMGAGGRITYRPNEHFNLFLQGDYLSLSLPNVDPISVVDGMAGVGYHIPLGERLSLNMNMAMGGYWAQYKDKMTSISGEISLSLEYKLNTIVSGEVNAAINHYNAGNTNLLTGAQISPGISLNITQLLSKNPKVNVETKRIDPIFPVLYSWYEKNPFGKISIENKEDNEIKNVSVKFFQPQYMSQPNECAKIDTIKKNESVDVDLTAFFNERMLDLLEMTDTQSTVTIEYEILGMKKSKTEVLTVPVCGRNSMSWEDDRRAAVFVSSKDPAAMWYSKLVSSIVRTELRSGVPESIQYAMGIFDTLDEFGINYVIDPTSAYADNIGTAAIDFLQFPYQTLMYRGGDCDDLSILTCSLFEAVGIHTAFITIPGHIFIAFDSGLSYEETKFIFSENDYFINHEGEAWIPVEITLTDEGFSKAWRTGAREWKTAAAQGNAAIFPMHDSWKIYKPVSVPGAAIKFTMLGEEKIARIYSHSIDEWISREINEQVEQYLAKIQDEGKVEDRNALGVLYGRYGLFDKAESQLKIARRQNYLPAIMNTANVYYSMKEFELAREWYRHYLKLDGDNALALLGVAKCSYELEDFKECDEAFSKVMEMTPSLARNNTYLGAFENESGRAFSLAERLSNTVWVRSEEQLSLYQSNPAEENTSEDFAQRQNRPMVAKNDTSEKSEEEKSENEKPGLDKKPNDEEEKADERISSNAIAMTEEDLSDLSFLENLPDGVLSPDEVFDEDENKESESDKRLVIDPRENSLAITEIDIDIEGLDEFEVDRIIGLQNQIEIPKAQFENGQEPDLAKYENPKPQRPILTTEKPSVPESRTELPAEDKNVEIAKVDTAEPEQAVSEPIPEIPAEVESVEIAKVDTEEPEQAVSEPIPEIPAEVESVEIAKVDMTEPEQTVSEPIPEIPAEDEIFELAQIDTAEPEQTVSEPIPEIPAEVESVEIAKVDTEEPEQAVSEPIPEIPAEDEIFEIAKIDTTEPEQAVSEPLQEIPADDEIFEIAQIDTTMPEQTVSEPIPKIPAEDKNVEIAKADTTEPEQTVSEPIPEIPEEDEIFEIAQIDTTEPEQAVSETEGNEDMSDIFDQIWEDNVAVAKADEEPKNMSDVFDRIWDDEVLDTEEVFLHIKEAKKEIAEMESEEKKKDEGQLSGIAIAVKNKEKEFENREAIAAASGVDKKALNGKENEEVDTPKENVEEPEAIVSFRQVPRYTETAASKWATEESYTQDIIPGMKSYEEEMGITDEKSYLTEDNRSFLRSPDKDIEIIEEPKEKEKPKAILSIFEEEEKESEKELEELIGKVEEKKPTKKTEKKEKSETKIERDFETGKKAETIAQQENQVVEEINSVERAKNEADFDDKDYNKNNTDYQKKSRANAL